MSADDDLPEIVARRKRKHAKAQARSTAKRRAKNAPSRDDLGRAAYHTILNVYAISNAPERIKAQLRLYMLQILQRAGFDFDEAATAFDKDADASLDGLNAWLARRWYEDGRRLGDDRGPYRPVTGRSNLIRSADE